MKKKMKGITIFVAVSIILIAACFAPSLHASENKGTYSRYTLTSESVSGQYKTCVYRNIRGESKSISINKGKQCPSTLK